KSLCAPGAGTGNTSNCTSPPRLAPGCDSTSAENRDDCINPWHRSSSYFFESFGLKSVNTHLAGASVESVARLRMSSQFFSSLNQGQRTISFHVIFFRGPIDREKRLYYMWTRRASELGGQKRKRIVRDNSPGIFRRRTVRQSKRCRSRRHLIFAVRCLG